MSRKRKPSRAVQRHRKALQMAKGVVSENLYVLYDALCEQPLRRRALTAWRILRGQKLGAK